MRHKPDFPHPLLVLTGMLALALASFGLYLLVLEVYDHFFTNRLHG